MGQVGNGFDAGGNHALCNFNFPHHQPGPQTGAATYHFLKGLPKETQLLGFSELMCSVAAAELFAVSAFEACLHCHKAASDAVREHIWNTYQLPANMVGLPNYIYTCFVDQCVWLWNVHNKGWTSNAALCHPYAALNLASVNIIIIYYYYFFLGGAFFVFNNFRKSMPFGPFEWFFEFEENVSIRGDLVWVLFQHHES